MRCESFAIFTESIRSTKDFISEQIETVCFGNVVLMRLCNGEMDFCSFLIVCLMGLLIFY